MIQYNVGTVETVELIKVDKNKEIWNFTIKDSEDKVVCLNSFVRKFPDPVWDENGISEFTFVPSDKCDADLKSLGMVPHLIVTLTKRDVPSAISDDHIFKNKPVKFYFIEQ